MRCVSSCEDVKMALMRCRSLVTAIFSLQLPHREVCHSGWSLIARQSEPQIQALRLTIVRVIFKCLYVDGTWSNMLSASLSNVCYVPRSLPLSRQLFVAGVTLLTFIPIIISKLVQSPPHSYIPRLKPLFSANPSRHSNSFSSSGLTPLIPRTVYRYF